MHHNQWIGRLPCAKRLFSLARNMSDIVVPLEYGITANEKLAIAQGICSPLLRKIKADLNQVVNYTDDAENINRLHPRFVNRTHLAFTPSAFIYLRNSLRFQLLQCIQWSSCAQSAVFYQVMTFCRRCQVMDDLCRGYLLMTFCQGFKI
jgi:hypothetical protein